MPATLKFFDMSVSTTPPSGHLEPLPVTLGPNWQPGDIRMMFISAVAAPMVGAESELEIPMNPDPPAGFTAAYSRNPGWETVGTYFRRLQAGDNSAGVVWPKPSGWRHFMLALLTVRGASPTTNPTAGLLNITASAGSTTASASSVTVPSAGTVVFFAGSTPAPGTTPWPNWAVSMGAPSGWTNLVASENSGASFYQYNTDPAVIVVGRSYGGSGSTGSVAFQTGRGAPAFPGMWAFITPAADVSASIGAV